MINVQLLYSCIALETQILLLKTPRLTVYYTISWFKEFYSTVDCPRSKRPLSIQMPKVINGVRAQIWRNPNISKKAMARDMIVSEKTMKKIVNTDLKLSTLKRAM